MNSPKKQAVILVHGIGEQRPMETVREFVKSVWVKDESLQNTRFWNKPSEVSESFEHRRLTTDYAVIKSSESAQKTSRVDFYEYYWAHHTVGTTIDQVKSWLVSMLLRKPSDFPSALRPVIYLVWTLIFAIAMLFWFTSGNEDVADPTATSESVNQLSWFYFTILKPLLILGLGALLGIIVNYLGDVARYITASPSNIKVRQAIRDGGVKLLESIVATGKYDRIVLVGHSLGSVIAYDVLTQYWARSNKFKSNTGKSLPLSNEALALIHEMESIDGSANMARYRELQHQLFLLLQQDVAQAASARVKHSPWLISDLVTLGSPLTYADFMLFKDKKHFVERKLDREYPTAPPVKENQHYYYQTENKQFLHHGAVFAPVRWTNIYSPSSKIFCGDIISGPVSRAFANPQITQAKQKAEFQPVTPVLDIAVEANKPGSMPDFFTHTNYWKWHSSYDQVGSPEHIVKLRQALNLTSFSGDL